LGSGLSNYCPYCGTRLAVEDAKFCPECGKVLKPAKAYESTDAEEKLSRGDDEELRAGIFELGNRLEEVVERIFQARGFRTERRQRLEGKSGTKSEIDVIARKSGKVFAIECKNYASPVGIDKVRDFAKKLDDLGSEWNGIFVSFSGFTGGAAQFAGHSRIQTWGHDEISEKWLAISVGRAVSGRGQSATLEYALPINVDFLQATRLDLQNRNVLKAGNVELIFHPYFMIEYVFKAQYTDPTKKVHRFQDRDSLFIDALDGNVLNPLPSKAIGWLKKVIKTAVSSTARVEDERTKILIQELRSNSPQREYVLPIEGEYQVNKLKPLVTPRQAEKLASDYVIEKNTQQITYQPKSKDDGYFTETKSIEYVPRKADVRIKRKDLAVVPRWSVEFDSIGRNYVKEIMACSGTVIEDTLSNCPYHFKIGAFSLVSKKTVAVCEVCGESLCEDHVQRCPICGKWLCQEHGITCSECQSRFCEEHISLTCPICGSAICNSCAAKCPLCGVQYGKSHAVTCNRCGIPVCPNCLTTTGLIRKTRTCKKCAA
jgi:hypothetical protein